MIDLYNGDCVDVLNKIDKENAVIVTDPPFNIGYKYASYKDKMETNEYYDWLSSVLTAAGNQFVCIHYPESLYELAEYELKMRDRDVICDYDVAWGTLKLRIEELQSPGASVDIVDLLELMDDIEYSQLKMLFDEEDSEQEATE